MPKKISIEELSLRASKDELQVAYEQGTASQVCQLFHLSLPQLNTLLAHYEIHKRTKQEAFKRGQETMLKNMSQNSDTTDTEVADINTVQDVEPVEEHCVQDEEVQIPNIYDKISDFLNARKLKFKRECAIDGCYFDYVVTNHKNIPIAINVLPLIVYQTEQDLLYCKTTKDVIYLPFVIEDEKYCFDELDKLVEMSMEQYYIDAFNWCKEQDFPFPSYSDDRLQLNWEHVTESDAYAEQIISHFHKTLFGSCKQNCLSPTDAWLNDKLLLLCLRYKFVHKANRLCPCRALDALLQSPYAPQVAVASVTRCTQLIQRYLSQYSLIFDPFHGWSEIMLAATSLGKSYIGLDINSPIVQEANEMARFLNIDAKTSCADSSKTRGKYECMFAYVPNKNTENYRQNVTTYFCDEWVDKIRANYTCKKYLLVVDDTYKYKSFVVGTIEGNKKVLLFS